MRYFGEVNPDISGLRMAFGIALLVANKHPTLNAQFVR